MKVKGDGRAGARAARVRELARGALRAGRRAAGGHRHHVVCAPSTGGARPSAPAPPAANPTGERPPGPAGFRGSAAAAGGPSKIPTGSPARAAVRARARARVCARARARAPRRGSAGPPGGRHSVRAALASARAARATEGRRARPHGTKRKPARAGRTRSSFACLQNLQSWCSVW